MTSGKRNFTQLYFVAQFVKRHLLTPFIAQGAQIFYDFFRKEIFNYGLEDLYMRLFKYLSHNVRIGGVR